MVFLKRIGMIIYMLLMLASGVLFLLVSLGTFSPERWIEWLKLVEADVSYQIAGGIIGGLFVIIGIATPYRMEKRFKKNRIVAFQNPDGEVTVSLSAIEDYIRKIAKEISGIKDVQSRVDINKKGINIITKVSITATANIPEVTEKIQMEVKNKVRGMLGSEEKINIKMHIKKITKGAEPEESSTGEGLPEAARIPYKDAG